MLRLTDLERVLMERDNLTLADARELIHIATDRVLIDGDDPEDVLQEEFGLEPDYVFDLFN